MARRRTRLLLAGTLLVVGVVLWRIDPEVGRVASSRLSSSALHILNLAGAVLGILGLGLLVGELFGTDSGSSRTEHADQPILGSNSFVAAVAMYVVSLVVSIVSGSATKTGPDGMVTGFYMLMVEGGLLIAVVRLGFLLESEWRRASRRERTIGMALCFGAPAWIYFMSRVFDLFAFK